MYKISRRLQMAHLSYSEVKVGENLLDILHRKVLMANIVILICKGKAVA